MSRVLAFGHRLPPALRTSLFGDRDRYGRKPVDTDPDWIAWQDAYIAFYLANQKSGIGRTVNHAGYAVVAGVDFAGKSVLEIGPGNVDHLGYWRARPERYVIADSFQPMLRHAQARLERAGIDHQVAVVPRQDPGLSCFAAETFDVVLSFYSLEHLYPLEPYVAGLMRVLRPGGLLVGAIPCEGGLAWGLGRFMTSRRWLRRHTTLDPGKILCWEHPNFAHQILDCLQRTGRMEALHFWPLRIAVVDFNLVAAFRLRKPVTG